MTMFQYDAQIIANYPHIVGGVIIAEGLSNPPTLDTLREQYAAEQAAVKARIGDTPMAASRSPTWELMTR
jgi:hypothetical protein